MRAAGPPARARRHAVEGADPLRAAAQDLLDGKILAVKGLGGYHLACRGTTRPRSRSLRARKHREDRPFALLVADVEAARTLVEVGEVAEALLTSRERPIVLARRLPDGGKNLRSRRRVLAPARAAVAPSVAPRAPTSG